MLMANFAMMARETSLNLELGFGLDKKIPANSGHPA
jgi:hypothetical protein